MSAESIVPHEATARLKRPRGSRSVAILTAAGGVTVVSLGYLAAANQLAATALVAGIALSAVVVVRPAWGLALLVAVIPVQASFMVEGATAAKIVGILVSGAWLVQKVLRGGSWRRILSERVVIFAALYFGLAFASLLWATYTTGVGRELFVLAQVIVLGLITFDVASSWSVLDRVAKALVFGALLAAVFTILQYFGGGVRRAGDEVAIGSINSTARMLVTVLPFAFYLVRVRAGAFWRLVGLLYVSAAVIGVAVTFSRTSFLLLTLALIAQYLFIVRTPRGRMWALASAAALAVAFTFLPLDRVRQRIGTIAPYLSETAAATQWGGTTSGRGYHYKIGFAIFADYPLLGAGYNNYGQHFLEYQRRVPGTPEMYRNPRSPHGAYHGVLAELGIVGFAILLLLLYRPARYLVSAWARWRRGPGSVPFLFVQALALSFFLQPLYGFAAAVQRDKLFWVLLGMAVAVRWLSRRDLSYETGPERRVGTGESPRVEAVSFAGLPQGRRQPSLRR